MDSITVLVTGAGAPGIAGTIYSLKNNPDNRSIRIVGVDMKEDVVGKYLCDAFFKIPAPSERGYLDTVIRICDNEGVDVILPQTTNELYPLSQGKEALEKAGIKLALSNADAIEKSNDKYELFKLCEKLGVPVPKYALVSDFESLMSFAGKLGFPNKPFVIKPPVASGMRGLRIVDDEKSLKEMFYDEKPNGAYCRSEQLRTTLGEKFPPLLVMEYLPGDEYSVDCFRGESKNVAIPRKRDLIRTGITFNGTLEERKDIIEWSTKLAEEIGLEYCFGFQYKLDEKGVPKMLESNPRVQGTMVAATIGGANVIYASILLGLGERAPEFNIKWGARIMRYWGGIGSLDDKRIADILV